MEEIKSSSAVQSLDKKLIETGKWAITMGQVIGYLPYSICKNQTLKFKFISLPVLSYVVLASVIFLQNFVFGTYLQETTNQYQNLFTKFEMMVYTIVGSLMVSSSFVYKLVGILQYKKIKRFWESNSALLNKFSEAGFNFFGDDADILNQIRKSCRSTALLIYVAAIFQFAVVFALGYYNLFPVLSDLPKLVHFFDGIWYFYFILHFGHFNWILFFIKLYSGFLHLITRRISLIKCRSKDNNVALLELRIQTYISLFYGIESEIDTFNEYFGSKIVFEVFYFILGTICNVFYIVQLTVSMQLSENTTASLSILVPLLCTICMVLALNDLGSTVSQLNSEFRSFSRVLERLCDLDISASLHQKVSKF